MTIKNIARNKEKLIKFTMETHSRQNVFITHPPSPSVQSCELKMQCEAGIIRKENYLGLTI